MNCSPRELIVLMKKTGSRIPNMDMNLLLRYIETAQEEDFNSCIPDPVGVKRLDLLFLESTFHDLKPGIIQALFDNTQHLSLAMQNRELARSHWETVLGRQLR